MIYITNYNSPIGKLKLKSKDGKLIGVCMEEQQIIKELNEEVQYKDDEPILIRTREWLDKYFDGEKPQTSDLDIELIGSKFAKLVWKQLCEIPYGKITTYGEIAKKVAQIMKKDKMSAQAVGGAVGRNPICIIIPCHRVVGKNGNLTGYTGGIDKKIKLLEHENLDMSMFFYRKRSLHKKLTKLN